MFIPIRKSDISLILNPEQKLKTKTNEIRHTKLYLTVNFFNGLPYVEACVFAHFSVDNAKEKSLVKIFANNFFKKLFKRQPYNKNLLFKKADFGKLQNQPF